ncbi:MAG TPA: N-acetylmuramoyl-L-alanine amidase [Ferruginibacter sp.]|nr:N-acetylmuramoyl-L-alanine amidase [Ferruginibacter sp.]
MLSFAFYLLKVMICSAVLFGYYWFFLRNKIFHSYNRFYLLSITVLSALLPLVKVDIFYKAEEPAGNVIKMLQVVNAGDEYMDEIILYSNYRHISREQVAVILYALICMVLFFMLVRVFVRVRQLLKKYPVLLIDNIHFVMTNEKGTPFSFFKFIFWNEAIDLASGTGKQVLKHEMTHIRHMHSHDKLFLNIILIFFWCNPVFWIIRKELNMIHEVIADKNAIEKGDTAAFASMILQATYPAYRFPLANNFFYSPIKRRLHMLTLKNNPTLNYISRLLVLPVVLFVIAAFTFKAKTYPGYDSNRPFTVVIDAGHGGKDLGARSVDGIYEKDINLALAKKIKELNLSKNLRLVLTRESDVYQDPKSKANFTREEKADLFISLHVDAINPTASEGMSVLVAKDQYHHVEKSKVFASALINLFENNYELEVQQHPVQNTNGIWVLQEAGCPAVLIESGNMGNKADVNYLLSLKGQETFANNVLKAIASYKANQNANNYPAKFIDTVPVEVRQPPADLASKDQTPYSAILKKAKSDSVTDAYQVTNPDEERVTSLNQLKPLYILDGKVVSINNLDAIKHDLLSVTVLKGENATRNYGPSAKDGAIEIVSKKDTPGPSMDTVLTLSGISNSKIDIAELEKITELQISSPDYKVVSASVYFHGAGFKNVTMSVLQNGSLKNIKPYMDRLVAGSILTFDDVIISLKSRDSRFEISGKSFSFFDKETRDVSKKVFTDMDITPSFPGGQEEWTKFLKTNLNPSLPVDEGWKAGTYQVVVNFIVDTKGNVTDVTTSDYPGSKTAQACVDLIRNGPKWIPAVQNGLVVNAYKKQLITFVVSEE